METTNYSIPSVRRQIAIQPISEYGSRVKTYRPKFQEAFLVYCPVCQINYMNSQIGTHMKKHYVADKYDFSYHQPQTNEQHKDFRIQKDLSRTAQSVISTTTLSYPLIQPLQFWTNQLNEVSKQDKFKFILNEDYNDIKQEKKIQYKPKIQKQQILINTSKRPCLQQPKTVTNLYNCFDNIVNNRNKFSIDDIWKNNQGLSSKRQLNLWEQATLKSRN